MGAENKKTETDHWGRYLFENLPPGEYRVFLPGTELFSDIRITDHNVGEVNFE